MTEHVETTALEVQPSRKVSIFDMTPTKQTEVAAEMATALRDIIRKQGLYSNIQGKEYVKVEGWTTLGMFLGILPRESRVTEHDDGSYEAYVDLVRAADGIVIGGASALCSVQEKRWSNAEKYSRRSMAVTRATGKAYRLAFSWIVTLAGYEPTPSEEIPDDTRGSDHVRGGNQSGERGVKPQSAGGPTPHGVYAGNSEALSVDPNKALFSKAAREVGITQVEDLKRLWAEAQANKVTPSEFPEFLKRSAVR